MKDAGVVDAYWSSSLYLFAVCNGEGLRLTAPLPGSKWKDSDPAFPPNGRDLVFAERCICFDLARTTNRSRESDE